MDLIMKEDWKLAAMMSLIHPTEARTWFFRPGFFAGKYDSKVLPIHQACALRPPRSFVETLYQVYPEGFSLLEDKFGRTPLHIACQTDASLETIKTLLEVNVEAAKAKDKPGRTPLHYAYLHKAPAEVVEVLLQAFPESIRCADENGWLPIHVASKNCTDPKVLRLLIGQDPTSLKITTDKGSTPLMLAKKSKHEEVANLIKQLEGTRNAEFLPKKQQKEQLRCFNAVSA